MEQQGIELSHYTRLLWRGKWVILLTALVAIVGVVVFTGLQPDPSPSFRATATVKIEAVSAPSALLNELSPLSSDRSLNTEIQLIGSRNVMERALFKIQPDSVNNTPDVIALQVAQLQREISVRSVPNTNLLELRAQAGSPVNAQNKANAIVEAYIEYVKEARTGAIEEALFDIRAQLAGDEQASGPAASQLAVLLPSLGSELETIAGSVEKSHQVLTELQGQQNPVTVGISLKQEIPQIERAAKELGFISQELQAISGDIAGETPQPDPSSDDALTLHASRLESIAKDLNVIHGQVDEIRREVRNLDPSGAFESAIDLSDDAQVILRRIPLELSSIRSNTLGGARELTRIESYVETVINDLRGVSVELRSALGGTEITKTAKLEMRGQLLANTLGLESAASDLENIRDRGRSEDFDGSDISNIAAAEADIRTAVKQIDLLSDELSIATDTSSLQKDLTQSLNWISESSQGLVTISNNFLRIPFDGDPLREEDLLARAGIELEQTGLKLGVASTSLRSLQSAINDPFLQAKLGSATNRLTGSQGEITAVSTRLTGRSAGRTVVTLDSLRIVGDRIQGDAQALSATLAILQPDIDTPNAELDANSAVQAYSNTFGVVQSLDIATRQLQSLTRGNLEPLLAGELGALSDRLDLAYANVKVLSSRLASLALVNPVGQPSGGLSVVTFRLVTATFILHSAAASAQSGLVLTDIDSLSEAAYKFKEQTDSGIAILGLVASDLTAIQNAEEMAPERYGQLAAAAENIRLSGIRASNLSSQLQQLQEGRGLRYFELQQLRAQLEISLLQPQETGITLVDSPVSVAAATRSRTFFSSVQLPLGGVAGLFLGCLAVLLKAQISQTAGSSAQLRNRLGLPMLGVIPRVKRSRASSQTSAAENDSSAFSEAMQLVGASLSGPMNPGSRSLLVTSAVPQEGKTAVTINLARVLAQYGHRVIVVDGNLRKPDLAQRLNLPQQEGLSTALSRQQNPVDYIVETATFAVLPGGQPPPNPVELLSSPAMSYFLQQLQNRYDVVLIDSAPAVGFAEIKALASIVSGAILVVKGASTSFELVSKGKEELEAAGVQIVGTILNFASDEECAHLNHENYRPSNPSSNGGRLRNRIGNGGKNQKVEQPLGESLPSLTLR